MMSMDELRADLSAFADDEDDVAVDSDGTFVFRRDGLETTARLNESVEGNIMVSINGSTKSYRTFLMRDLARLDIFAERLVARRQPVNGFVDGLTELRQPVSEAQIQPALETLVSECEEAPPFAARVCFITADAGYGKSALLREFQARQATAFLSGEASYLFWHVDLQGRQLLRLSEALMGDLGELRVSGLWMPAITTLMRHRALVLAVDGFDELAAEQGGTDALGSLANLLNQLSGRGVVVAAARRTFFDTEDYLKRSGLLKRALSSPCEFDQMTLQPWKRDQGIQFLENAKFDGRSVDEPADTYDAIASELGGESNPLVSTPFLLAQVARALVAYDISASEFVHSADDPMSGVATVVDAFVKREVKEKWVYADTGEPYLDAEQHMQLLADIAEEMYRGQRDRLDVDVIETIATLLVDQWNIDPSRRQQVLEMVRMHVLLVIPPDSDGRVRSFDHPEFRDFFIAYALRTHIERALNGEGANGLARFLSIAQISDGTARYVCSMLNRTASSVPVLLSSLEQVVRREWKPTFLQVNVGTLIPAVLDGISFPATCNFSAKVIYSSLVFERSNLINVELSEGSFVNCSFRGVVWENVTLHQCELGEVALDESASFQHVTFLDCTVDGIRLDQPDDEVREYAPYRVAERLSAAGIVQANGAGDVELQLALTEETYSRKLLRRVLRLFNRTTIINDKQLETRFKHDRAAVSGSIMPLLEAHEIVIRETWAGAGSGQVWKLNERIDEVLAAEGSVAGARFADLWAEVDSA